MSTLSVRQTPRELRRRVMLRARMRAISGWTNACILNVSSHGMMINAPAASAVRGSTVELWHGDRMIVATVVWRNGTRAGVQVQERIPVDEILAVSQSSALLLTAAGWPQVERRKRPRGTGSSRLRSRLLEFASVVLVASALAVSAFFMVEDAFATPLQYVQSALGG